MLEDGIVKTAPPWDRLEPGPLGVRRYERDRAEEGYTLFCPGQSNLVLLIDPGGMVVHFWPVRRSHLVELLPNGRLLADEWGSSPGLRELTPDGEVTWRWDGPYHHDFHYLDQGDRVVLLTHRTEEPMEGFFAAGERPTRVRNDVVLELDRDGRVVWEFNLGAHALELAELAGLELPVRFGMQRTKDELVMLAQDDWTHTNTIEVLPENPVGASDERFRAGNLLFSCRSLDTIGVIDLRSNRIVWAWGPGVLDGQHHPTMLPNGNLLVFDNGTYRGYSIVRELEPPEMKEVWTYQDPGGFFSPYRSGAQRLPAGNTLVCESDAGRIFEVTPDGAVVWDYYSPYMGTNPGNEGRHVYRATRYSRDQIAALVAQKAPLSGVGLGQPGRGCPFDVGLDAYEKGFLAAGWSPSDQGWPR